MELMLEEMKAKNGSRGVKKAAGGNSGGKSRQIDSFLEEMKSRSAPSMPVFDPKQPGSFDNGDPATTNLYVGNLAPTITEELVQEKFGEYGQIFSVKIMWPRTDEERMRKRNCGFVSFVRREDAEEAKNAMHDEEIEGYRITIGWGKAVKRPPNLQVHLHTHSTHTHSTRTSPKILWRMRS